jgi:hypothetical protein
MKFEWKITFGDLLTFASILVSAAGLAWTWHQDILTRERDQATEVRKAAASTLAKLERLGQLTDVLFADLQPTIVEASDLLAKNHDPDLARDYFWKTVSAARLAQRKRVLDEQIENDYVTLYSYVTQARPLFQSTIKNLRSAEDDAIENILVGCQDKFREYDPKHYTRADLGNKCRDVLEAEREAYFNNISTILSPLKQRLEGIVSEQDSAIISGLNAKSL